MDYTILTRARLAQSALTASRALMNGASPDQKSILEQRIRAQQVDAEQLYREALATADTVDDPRIREILLLRCLKGLHWEEVADSMDGNMNAEAIKQRFCRWKKANHAII